MTPKYVAGFLFSPNFELVVLIHKNRPDWQAGKVNAVGGKIEEGENSTAAMQREFEEETGLRVLEWKEFALLSDMRGYAVSFLYAIGNVAAARTVEDEEIEVFQVSDLPDNCIPNLHWLIPMAINIKRDNCDKFEITERVK